MDNPRQQRGLILAATAKIQQKGSVWLVPSQSDKGHKYTVCPDEQMPHCTCPDHETRGVTCKHIFAVRIVQQRELFPDGTETVTNTVTVTETVQRKTYAQDWTNYNKAQTNEKDLFLDLLYDLCEGLEDGPKTNGRPRIKMADAIFSACFKVFSTLSGRRFMSDLRAAKDNGYITKTPHFNSVLNVLENPETTKVLESLVIQSSLPLQTVEQDFAVDSTGFTTSRFHRWFDHKYGQARQEHDWIKAHMICGVKTNVVTAVEIYERNTNDNPILPSLVATTAQNFAIAQVSADKQYASENNFRAIAGHNAQAFIAFRSGTTGRSGGYFQKAYQYFCFNRDEFLAAYHKRSNVESTVMMIKAKFGDAVRSKTDTAMKNEVLAKVVCHNICCLISAMFEFGLEPLLSCTKRKHLAQEVLAI